MSFALPRPPHADLQIVRLLVGSGSTDRLKLLVDMVLFHTIGSRRTYEIEEIIYRSMYEYDKLGSNNLEVV